MTSLDELDKRILQVLQLDASLSNQELAERVHASPPTCLRRVNRLRKEGVIAKQVAILAPEKLGLGLNRDCRDHARSSSQRTSNRFREHDGDRKRCTAMLSGLTRPRFCGDYSGSGYGGLSRTCASTIRQPIECTQCAQFFFNQSQQVRNTNDDRLNLSINLSITLLVNMRAAFATYLYFLLSP